MTLADRLRIALDASHAIELLEGDERYLAPTADPLTPAAVLVAVTDRVQPGVILTQRTDTLRRHAGQIAFPGGRVDPQDNGVEEAALREAEEEIALPRSSVTVIGTADRYRTGTGFDITPIVGVIPPDIDYFPNEGEVASVFEVPLAFLLDPANQQMVSAEWQGRQRTFYEIQWQDRRIWGATAGMIVNLARRLRWA